MLTPHRIDAHAHFPYLHAVPGAGGSLLGVGHGIGRSAARPPADHAAVSLGRAAIGVARSVGSGAQGRPGEREGEHEGACRGWIAHSESAVALPRLPGWGTERREL